MNDNRVSISTELDNSGIEKGAREIKGELGGVEGVVNNLSDALSSAFSGVFNKSIAAAADQVRALEAQLEKASSEKMLSARDNDEKGVERWYWKEIKLYDQLEAARHKLYREIAAAAQKEAEAEERVAKRAADAKIKEEQRAAQAKQREAEKQQKAALKPLRRFGNRLQSIVSGALVFNLLSAGLRTMTQYFGNALKSNQQFAASFAKLKGALMTAFQPIYELALPALLALMRVLTAIIQVVGQFFAVLSGKTTKQMAENAEALNKEANAIEGVGGAAKEAKRQLAGFDEINKLNANNAGGGGGGSSSIAPDFDPIELANGLEYVKYLIGAVGAALLTWKLASAFGTTGAAVGLLIGGIVLCIMALQEWIKTGELSNAGALALTLGILAIGSAISLLTGSWIPLLIAGVTAFVLAAATKADEIKNVLSKVNSWLQDVFARDWRETFGPVLGSVMNGFMETVESVWGGVFRVLNGAIDFIRGVFTGDWERALGGIVSIFGGAIDVIMGIVRAPFEWIGTALFNLAQKTLPESWKNGINAASEVINKFISWLNKTLTFSLPPIVIAGKTIFGGGSIQLVNLPDIPMLAQGAVIPPNAPFMAMLGDQRHGTNIEAPLSTIQEAVALVMDDQMSTMMVGFEALLAENRLLREVVEGIEIGDEVLGKAVNRYNARLATMRGDG